MSAPSPTFIILDGDRPKHTLTTPERIEKFTKFLEKTNTRRRRQQERLARLADELDPSVARRAG